MNVFIFVFIVKFILQTIFCKIIEGGYIYLLSLQQTCIFKTSAKLLRWNFDVWKLLVVRHHPKKFVIIDIVILEI